MLRECASRPRRWTRPPKQRHLAKMLTQARSLGGAPTASASLPNRPRDELQVVQVMTYATSDAASMTQTISRSRPKIGNDVLNRCMLTSSHHDQRSARCFHVRRADRPDMNSREAQISLRRSKDSREHPRRWVHGAALRALLRSTDRVFAGRVSRSSPSSGYMSLRGMRFAAATVGSMKAHCESRSAQLHGTPWRANGQSSQTWPDGLFSPDRSADAKCLLTHHNRLQYMQCNTPAERSVGEFWRFYGST